MSNSSNNPWKSFSFVLMGVLIGVLISVPLMQNANVFASLFKPDEQKKAMVAYADQTKEEFAYYTQNTTKTDDGFYRLGQKDAPVQITEFSDFQCPYCLTFFQNTLGQIKTAYVKSNKVALVYKDLPLSFHPNAFPAAEAAKCAGEQGQFFQMHDMLFNFHDMWADEKDSLPIFAKMAKVLGLNNGDYQKCMEQHTYKNVIQGSAAESGPLKIDGTPGFVINDQLLVGAYPFPNFQEIIDPILNKTSTTK